ncbi:hypothetical protein E3N88_26163 [Mikania micrantha]|uniref:non-specific serine/threonine protein kinase n=1 Tax=Mikania micrantha TaxID=192012 RepID=A0A5N6N6W7_9ASTR|nr:hypothetical protein E3N88_26163 [Mikania micrantha]
MGNCCATPSTTDEKKRGKKPNPFSLDYGVPNPSANSGYKTTVLENPTGNEIEKAYILGKEMGRGEFGITYMCTDKVTAEVFACKSISKKKLRTRVDIEDVKREVDIMKHMPPHPNIVSLKDTYKDDNAVHLVMELCEGGELFDRIVARGHYTERAAAGVTKTIVEVIQAADLLKHLHLQPYVLKLHLNINGPRRHSIPSHWSDYKYEKTTTFIEPEPHLHNRKMSSFSSYRALNPSISEHDQYSSCSQNSTRKLSIGSVEEYIQTEKLVAARTPRVTSVKPSAIVFTPRRQIASSKIWPNESHAHKQIQERQSSTEV